MKVNIIKSLPKILAITFFCFLFSNCKNEKFEKEINSYKDSLNDCRNKNYQDSLTNYKEYYINKMDEPIPPPTRGDMRPIFRNNYGLNTSLNIDTVPLSISLDSVKSATGFINSDTTQDTLIAKYFVLVTPPTPGENKYFSYVIAAAQKTTSPVTGNDTISPISHPSGGFLLVTKNNNHGKLITSAEFRTMLNDYTNNVRFVQGGQTRNVKDYFHPYVSYHPTQEFLKFYNHNNLLFQNENAVDIIIENGAVKFTLPIKSRLDSTVFINLKCQSPIFIFKEGNTLYLDNINRGLNNYIMKGMNVGRLCPPQCD
jgi:hypothetical protein